MNYQQKKLSLIAFFLLWATIILLTIASFAKPSEASAMEIRNDGIIPPRIQQICYDNYLGRDFSEAKKYEKRCRKLWNVWTEEHKAWMSANGF